MVVSPLPPASSQPSLQDQQRWMQQPLPPLAGRGAQMCLSHQLLFGQRWQNLRLQLHGQPGNSPACPAMPCALVLGFQQVPAPLRALMLCIWCLQAQATPPSCGTRQHTQTAVVWGCPGGPEGICGSRFFPQLRIQHPEGIQPGKRDKAFGVLPPCALTSVGLSIAVCLQERQVHPFLVEMRHRGRLRGPLG